MIRNFEKETYNDIRDNNEPNHKYLSYITANQIKNTISENPDIKTRLQIPSWCDLEKLTTLSANFDPDQYFEYIWKTKSFEGKKLIFEWIFSRSDIYQLTLFYTNVWHFILEDNPELRIQDILESDLYIFFQNEHTYNFGNSKLNEKNDCKKSEKIYLFLKENFWIKAVDLIKENVINLIFFGNLDTIKDYIN